MPKGVRNSSVRTPSQTLERIQLDLVPARSKVYPNSQCSAYPEGVPLPDGVRVRSEGAVELRFNYKGQRITETLRLRPTVAVVRAAGEQRTRVLALIALGKFGDKEYQEEFPLSKRQDESVQTEDVLPTEVYTVGKALDDWLVTSWGGHSPNTRKDYVRSIRNQLKPQLLSGLGLPESAFLAGGHSGSQPSAVGFTSGENEQRFSRHEFSSTSTIPLKLVTEVLPLAAGEVASGRQRRHLAKWRRAGALRGLSPAETKSVTHYKTVELPLESLAQLRVTELTDLTASQIRTIFRESGLSVKRVNNLMSPLRQSLQRLVDIGKMESNPFSTLKPLTKSEVDTSHTRKVVKDIDAVDDSDVSLVYGDELDALDETDEPDPFTLEEMAKILGNFDAAMRNHYLFAFFSGLRTGELIALRESDVDWKLHRIRVRRSLSRGIMKKPKSGKSRWVQLLQPAWHALQAQLSLLGAPGGWVFPNPWTKDCWKNESKLTKRWMAALKRADVRYRRPYHTRHTYASMMLSAGENLLYVSEQLGHADWQMVQRRYARWIPSAHGRVAGSAIAEAQQSSWNSLMANARSAEPNMSRSNTPAEA